MIDAHIHDDHRETIQSRQAASVLQCSRETVSVTGHHAAVQRRWGKDIWKSRPGNTCPSDPSGECCLQCLPLQTRHCWRRHNHCQHVHADVSPRKSPRPTYDTAHYQLHKTYSTMIQQFLVEADSETGFSKHGTCNTHSMRKLQIVTWYLTQPSKYTNTTPNISFYISQQYSIIIKGYRCVCVCIYPNFLKWEILHLNFRS